MSSVANKVKDIIIRHLGVEAEKVTAEASFIEDLGADSLDTVELIMTLEEEFGCEIPEDVSENIVKVGQAIEYIENNVQNKTEH